MPDVSSLVIYEFWLHIFDKGFCDLFCADSNRGQVSIYSCCLSLFLYAEHDYFQVKHAMMQLYVLKLLKMQTKYLGRQWRKTNMKTMSAIYQKVCAAAKSVAVGFPSSIFIRNNAFIEHRKTFDP